VDRPRIIDAVLIVGVSYFIYAAVLVILAGRIPARPGTAIASVSLLGSSYVLTRLVVASPMRYVGVRRVSGLVVFHTVVASFAAVVPVMSLQALLINFFKIPTDVLEELARFLHADTPGDLIQLWLIIAVGGALSEEFVFRGVLQNCLSSRLRPWLAILIASLVFGALHTYRFPSAALLGCFLGFIYWRTKSLVPAVVGHLTINSIVLVLMFVFEHQVLAQAPDWVMQEKPAPLAVVVLSLAVLAASLWGLARATGGTGSSVTENAGSKGSPV
jgi:membrane protease YdiL (CAAX protease family)